MAGDIAPRKPDGLVDFGGRGKYSPPEFVSYTVGLTDITFLNSDKLGKKYENDKFVGDFHNGYLYHFDLTKNRRDFSLTNQLKTNLQKAIKNLRR